MNVRAALEFCAREGAPNAYSCAAVMAAAAPADSLLAAAYGAFDNLAPKDKVRCLRNVEAGARVVAWKIRAKRVPRRGTDDAWGVLHGGDGRICFAFRSAGVWYARSSNGLAKMSPILVIRAWELK